MKNYNIIIGIVIILFINIISINAFNEPGSNPYGIPNNEPVNGNLIINGKINFQPLAIYPKGMNYPYDLGNIYPGQTITYSQAEQTQQRSMLWCCIMGALGYNISITGEIEIEKDKVHIVPIWWGGDYYIDAENLNIPPGGFTHNATIDPVTGGYGIGASIAEFRADPGAPCGIRLFTFKLTAIYVE